MTLPAFVAMPVLTGTAALAQQQPGSGDNGGQGEDFGKSSPVGLLLLLLFFIAVVFLVRSMTKHLKRVPASFDEPAPEQAAEPKPEGAEGEGVEGADGEAKGKAEAVPRSERS
ncbi:hypothetical protein [Prauserella cavernicola]|uniref:Preprotein translocase subunit SecG n=1 Tax=Prauserella cavernicola TaxID=2800127 RepID=A0A934QU25_9PSEU|nr:hypothetical protein [Prauserella cavernicola]MBK1785629.1 hypothetical protein [Prauserella cavernicola]